MPDDEENWRNLFRALLTSLAFIIAMLWFLGETLIPIRHILSRLHWTG
jgi:hypothetical protein